MYLVYVNMGESVATQTTTIAATVRSATRAVIVKRKLTTAHPCLARTGLTVQIIRLDTLVIVLMG